MPVWLWVIDSIGLLLLLALAALAWLLIRRTVLTRRHGAAFDLSINRTAEPGRGWILGFASYRDTELLWFRTFSFSLRPKHRFRRGEVLIDGRRAPEGIEVHALHAHHVIVGVERAGGAQQFALSSGALTGLLSWLESSPPGQRVNNVV